MPVEVIVSLAVSTLVPWVLERLKWARWFPLIQPFAPALNRGFAWAVATTTALGIAVSFNAADGVLTITGLVPADILRVVFQAAGNFLVQEVVYRKAIDQPHGIGKP